MNDLAVTTSVSAKTMAEALKATGGALRKVPAAMVGIGQQELPLVCHGFTPSLGSWWSGPWPNHRTGSVIDVTVCYFS